MHFIQTVLFKLETSLISKILGISQSALLVPLSLWYLSLLLDVYLKRCTKIKKKQIKLACKDSCGSPSSDFPLRALVVKREKEIHVKSLQQIKWSKQKYIQFPYAFLNEF